MKILNNKRPVIVGIFILFGIIIFVVTIFTLGSQKKTFVKSYTIHAVFNDVGGLIKGGNVWFSGVKIGSVKSISFFGNSQVKITMSIEKKTQPYIHKDAMAKIGSDGLIGNKIVIIYGGNPNLPQAETNDFLHVENALNTDEMLVTLQANNKNLLEITKTFISISKKIDSGKGTLATLINDPSMAVKLSSTIGNLQSTATNFKTVSITSKDVLLNLKNFTANINKQGNLMNDLVKDTVIYRNIKTSMSQLENAANSISGFTANLKMASEKLHQKDNIAGVLLNDSTTAASIKISLKNIEASSQKLDDNLEALQHNFLLRGFFRKKEKVKQD